MANKELHFIRLMYLFFLIEMPLNSQKLLITEIAPMQENSNDWIEIFISEEDDFSNISLFECERKIKLLPNRQYKKGDIIVIQLNRDDEDKVLKDDYWQFFSTYNGIVATDNIISIRDGSGNWLDAVCFSNRDGDMSKTSRINFFNALSNNMWVARNITENSSDYDVQTSMIDWSKGKEGYSISRIRDVSGLPKDENTVFDWQLNKLPTKGWGYKEIKVSSDRIIEVDKNYNPFSPLDSLKNFTVINFNVPDVNYVKTIKVLNILGEEIVTLIDNDMPKDSSVYSYEGISAGKIIWDGRDMANKVVSCGIYVIYIEAFNSLENKKIKSKDVVVVGKRLKD